MIDNSAIDDILPLMKRAIREARRLQGRFKIAAQIKRPKLFALVVHNELMRKCESIVSMAEARADVGINTVARAAFENHADFKNLFIYGDDYSEYMMWAASNQQRSFLQPMINNESRFGSSFEKSANRAMGKSAAQLLAEAKKTMQKAESMLPPKFKTKDGNVQKRDMLRFELAGLVDEYNALYRHLSLSAHGRIYGMVDGILHGDGVKWPPSKPKTRPLVALDCSCAMLLEDSEFLAKRYRKPVTPIRTVIRAHVDVRGTEGLSILAS